MKKLAIVAIVILALVGAYMLRYPSTSWRYKMTVTVETPEGIKSGSAVREVDASVGPKFLPEQAAGRASVSGEAVVVDLGSRGKLFAILSNSNGPDYAYRIVFDAFPMPQEPLGSGGLTRAGLKYYSNLKDAKATLNPNQYPALVRFSDPNDPKSVEPVDPSNLAASFGSGVKLSSIALEMTDKPITTGIKIFLPSFGEGSGFAEWRRKVPYGDPRGIDSSVFFNGEK